MTVISDRENVTRLPCLFVTISFDRIKRNSFLGDLVSTTLPCHVSPSPSPLSSYTDDGDGIDLLQSQRHQADLLASLEAQVKAMTTKAASKEQAEDEQPILAGLKMIGGGAG